MITNPKTIKRVHKEYIDALNTAERIGSKEMICPNCKIETAIIYYEECLCGKVLCDHCYRRDCEGETLCKECYDELVKGG